MPGSPKGFALAVIGIPRLCSLVGKIEVVEGKLPNLRRKNFLRRSFSPHHCDLWGLAQPRLHPHTRTCLIPSFPSSATLHLEDCSGVWKVQLLVGVLSPPQLLAAPQHPLKASAHLPHHPPCTKAASWTQHPPEQSPSSLPAQDPSFHFLIFWSPFCLPVTEEGSGQHPLSSQGAGASSLCLTGADIILFVSLVSLVSRFFFLIEPLIKKTQKTREDSQIWGSQRGTTALPPQAWDPVILSQFLGFAPKLLNLTLALCRSQPDSKPHQLVPQLSITQPRSPQRWGASPPPPLPLASLCVCFH